ncbi:GDP-D-glucose phosphorylase 1 [Paragonimus heterotremus]|uniref:GDP-D-glucose phosphorylase 1 n=1 Tax=Paragonimus heterotremus TaxID=100268 RepID=A0A8J4WCT6_9TREM|nr:GDP-D-glucose phosphorylase 1 [Paragonimus heterotremus]
MQFHYSKLDLVLRANGVRSKFDVILWDRWMEAHNANKLRYQLNQPKPIIIEDSSLKPLVLLRRAPFMATSLDEPLLDSSFNFNKVAPEEVLLKIVSNEFEEKHSVLLANISPFAVLHCLFIPEPMSRFNQRLRKSALAHAIECFLLSSNSYLCMGFNSLLAHASVNHLHFHMWQTPAPLYAMTASTRVKENKPCYSELPEHPVHNFVVELTNVNNLNEFVNTIWNVVDACQSERIAHNLFLSRVVNTCGNVRAVLWPRRSVFEPKAIGEAANEQGYNLAVAELAGMYVVANEQVAKRITPKELESSLLAERLSGDVIHRLEQRIDNNH